MSLHPAVETDVDYSPFKVNGVAVFGILSALLLSYSLKLFLNSLSSISFVIFLATAALFLMALFLKVLFIKQIERVLLTIFLEGVALLSFFVGGALTFAVGGVFLAWVFCVAAYFAGRKEIAYGLKIHPFRISRVVLSRGITALSLFITFAYLSLAHTGGAIISEDIFKRIVLPNDAIVHYFYPQLSLTDTFADAARSLVMSNLGKNQSFVALPADQKTLAINSSLKDLKSFVKKEYLNNADFGDNDKLIDIIYRSFIQFLSRVPEGEQGWITFGFGLVFFLVIRSLGMLFGLLISPLAVVLYEILIASGFGLVVLETTSKEIVIAK